MAEIAYIHLNGITLALSRLRGLFWRERGTLVVTDLHLGKKPQGESARGYSGIEHELLRLSDLVAQFSPRRLIILGDLFDRSYSGDLLPFGMWLAAHEGMDVEMVLGTHDTRGADAYRDLGMNVHEEGFLDGTFAFAYKPVNDPRVLKGLTMICGHVHPSVRVYCEDHSFEKVPCCYVAASHIILPAFGEQAETTLLDPAESDHIYAVTETAASRIR
jgi:metallophosphoesterase superfamily enzyme